MAATGLNPGDWISGWVENAGTISMPLATFPKMTAADAHADTGDIRTVLFAMLEVLFQVWNAIPAADRPTQMTAWKSASIAASTGDVQKNYGFQFECESETSVKDEPVAE